LKIDLNCDLGESFGAFRVGNDPEMMRYVTSANIACGFHAGDPLTMAQTVSLAKQHKVAVGAHPGLPDLAGFGRREMKLAAEEAENYTLYQVSALYGFAKAAGLGLQHVKPHGALYNMAAKDKRLSAAIVRAVQKFDDKLILLAPPRSALASMAAKAKLRVALEFFADRAYSPDGSLAPRSQRGALIQKPHEVLLRAVTVVKEGMVEALDGKMLRQGDVQTICVHGDTPDAIGLVRTLRTGLAKAGIKVEPLGSFI
jgi:UPF0271 protein